MITGNMPRDPRKYKPNIKKYYNRVWVVEDNIEVLSDFMHILRIVFTYGRHEKLMYGNDDTMRKITALLADYNGYTPGKVLNTPFGFVKFVSQIGGEDEILFTEDRL